MLEKASLVRTIGFEDNTCFVASTVTSAHSARFEVLSRVVSGICVEIVLWRNSDKLVFIGVMLFVLLCYITSSNDW